MQTEKRVLRQQLRRARQALPRAERQRAQAACHRHLKRFVARGKRIALYWAVGSELKLDALMHTAWQRGAHVYLPYIEPRSLRLWFTPYTPTQRPERQNGAGSLRIPQFRGKKIRADGLHTLILPIVGIDQRGVRLGQGGGYYDCSLAACTHRPRLVAVGFACQQVNTLPIESHDCRADVFVSERGVQYFLGRKHDK